MTEQKNREGYIQISQHHWVKKDNFDYFTEKDLIKRVSEKFGIERREVEDLYTRYMEYMLNYLEKYDNDYDKGYYVPYLATFFKKRMEVQDLTKGKNTLRYIKAKKQLDYYMKFDSTIMKLV